MLDKSESRVREMFRQIAPRYDLMNHVLSLNIDRYWRWRSVRRLRIGGNSPILDTCTGTGDLALAIKRRAGESVKVVGSDFCNAMLQIADRKTKKATRENEKATFIEADSQALPFDDDQFQCVTVAFGLRNVTDTMRGLSEMHRVCKPGGQVMILEFSRPYIIGLRQLYQFYFTSVLPKIGQLFAKNDKSAYQYLPESVGLFPDGEELASLMREAGMVNVRYTPLTFGVATIYEGWKNSS
ncbi:bifunctional demethylmenaquinone methyltransferase/2-methoxy-6-polyprenyl-1,4-benzoquinol methylase UbiE [Rubripirellula sp.]|jgi:demethylmenaquinone methyltransferase/2-methoxy-6-polyprenyl-1,4-benzoquinol methylase|nr:bifunctional demethylmenaquinone methyltransferase/2-methoxy-6-polyprenyl-1,4-benzoquinol methylase UbiE [Rubripirellula sp.]